MRGCAGDKIISCSLSPQEIFFSVILIDDLEIPPCKINNAHVLFLVEYFRAYVLAHAKRTIFVTETGAMTRSEAFECAPLTALHDLNEAVLLVTLIGKHPHRALHDFQRAANVTWASAPLLVRCVTQRNGRPIVEMEALELSNDAIKGTSIERPDFSFVAIVKLVMNISAAFKKEYDKSFLFALMVDTIDDVALFNFLNGKCFRYTTSLSKLQILFFVASIFSIELRILMGRWRHLRRLASHASTMDPCLRPGQSKNCFCSSP